MSNNAWETTSPTSLHPLTHFFHAMIRYLAAYNDVGDVVSPSAIACSPKILYMLYTTYKNNFDHLLLKLFFIQAREIKKTLEREKISSRWR